MMFVAWGFTALEVNLDHMISKALGIKIVSYGSETGKLLLNALEPEKVPIRWN